ncbi:MAG TPA: hypothetical protein VF316_06470 [Polyangiaceae bacterium]
MKLLSPELWLRQAKADEAASRATGALAECHRRYFLQQAYEKAVKALALACLTRKQSKDKQLSSALGEHFLHHHTPWTVFSTKDDAAWADELRLAYGAHGPTLLRELKLLRQQVAVRMQDRADGRVVDAWKQIDGTRPRKAVDAVSYRYPFVDDAHVDGVAPKDWNGWSEYQGKEDVVRDAVAQLLRRAGDQVRIWNKGT